MTFLNTGFINFVAFLTENEAIIELIALFAMNVYIKNKEY